MFISLTAILVATESPMNGVFIVRKELLKQRKVNGCNFSLPANIINRPRHMVTLVEQLGPITPITFQSQAHLP